jgi:3-oxoacyl-[acyl-carrier-protein] synthase II
MPQSRVVVTGAGAVTSVGFGVNEFGAALRRGASGVSKITVFDTSGFTSELGCEVRNFAAGTWIVNLDPATLGRSSQFAVAAARMALDDAGLTDHDLAGVWCGVSVGTTDGESQPIDRLNDTWVTRGPAQLDPAVLKQVPSHRLATSIARELDVHGEVVTIPAACAAGNYAIGHAFDLIREGEADFMVCGGADSMCRKTFAGFFRLGTIAPRMCQPFDKNRQGLLTGEGAGMLFLERLDHAVARSAHIYAEILGYGLNCDAHHMVAPNRESIAACMRLAHANAGISPSDVDYVSAHGTGTRANDVTEAAAIRDVFGAPPPTSSIKSNIGHTMGAASALSAVACSIALDRGFIPPTINSIEPDPECGLDCVPNVARDARLRVVQNNAFAFGGNNSIVVLSGDPRRFC